MEDILKKGDLVTYLENNELKKGIVVANNACLYFSQTFQIIPVEINEKKLIFFPKKEFLIQRAQIKKILGRISLSKMRYIEKEIFKHHIAESNDVYKIGEVYLTNLPKIKGSNIQGGLRPVVIASGEIIDNKINVIPLTTKIKKQSLPTHFVISKDESFLIKDSMVLAEAEMTIDKDSLIKKLGEFNDEIIEEIIETIKIQHSIKKIKRIV